MKELSTENIKLVVEGTLFSWMNIEGYEETEIIKYVESWIEPANDCPDMADAENGFKYDMITVVPYMANCFYPNEPECRIELIGLVYSLIKRYTK